MITRREQQMLDLEEAGLGPAQIARQLGIKPHTVSAALNNLRPTSNAAWDDMVRRGTRALHEAIVRHHPEQLLMRPGRRA